jgi:hypothetical protein
VPPFSGRHNLEDKVTQNDANSIGTIASNIRTQDIISKRIMVVS